MSWIYSQTTVTWICVGLAILHHVMSTPGLYHFLKCPGNDGLEHSSTRECCRSEKLPYGCKCFDVSKESDFTNTHGMKPQCPDDLVVEFHLYTRKNRQRSFQVQSNDQSLSDSPFNGTKLTKFITHGFFDNITAIEFTDMTDALLEYGDMNVVLVSWKEAAKKPIFLQACANVRTVGAMVAQMVRVMDRDHGLSLDDVHCIGHGIGAHVCGAAGKEIESLDRKLMARITGLDATGQLFDVYSKNVRLDKTDAVFVDVIHTSDSDMFLRGVGWVTRHGTGTVDFYPNGGKHQPACDGLEFDDKFRCNHKKALEYFNDSILKCEKSQCDVTTSCVMGYHTNSSCTGRIYPVTAEENIYCFVPERQHFTITTE